MTNLIGRTIQTTTRFCHGVPKGTVVKVVAKSTDGLPHHNMHVVEIQTPGVTFCRGHATQANWPLGNGQSTAWKFI